MNNVGGLTVALIHSMRSSRANLATYGRHVIQGLLEKPSYFIKRAKRVLLIVRFLCVVLINSKACTVHIIT